MGVLCWPPSEFWDATVWDLYCAIDGYQKSKGVYKGRLSKDDIKRLKELARNSKPSPSIKDKHGNR